MTSAEEFISRLTEYKENKINSITLLIQGDKPSFLPEEVTKEEGFTITCYTKKAIHLQGKESKATFKIGAEDGVEIIPFPLLNSREGRICYGK